MVRATPRPRDPLTDRSALAALLRRSRGLPGVAPGYLGDPAGGERPPLDLGSQLDGSSPPGVFVGRYGYPKLNVGPLVPPVHGDTAVLDLPEAWLDFTLPEIVGFRWHLVRGMRRMEVEAPQAGTRLLQDLQEMAVARRPAEAEVTFTRPPRGGLELDRRVQPFGPSAPLRRFRADPPPADQRLEKVWYDTDLRAQPGMVRLYREGVEVSRIARALSIGLLGQGGGRKLVPTRWSITAVDDTVGKSLLERIRGFPLIDAVRVYESWKLENRFVVLVLPRAWSYELVEAWYPGTTWNPDGQEIAIFGSAEGYEGRTRYADIGGCYYAARLAIAEALHREGRQGAALVLRETHPGHLLPLGVWNVRENVRHAFAQPYRTFPDVPTALDHVFGRLAIPRRTWVEHSSFLRFLLHQRRLDDFGGYGA